MRKRAKVTIGLVIGVLAVGAVAAIAGPKIYRDFIAAPAADTPTLMANDEALTPNSSTGTDALDAAALSGTWSVADASEAGYRVNEVLNGTDVTVTGRTDQVTGTVTTDGTTITAATFSVDVASIATDSGSRDAYFRDDAMRVSQFPTADFVLTSPISMSVLPAPGETVEQEVTGELTLAGVTQQVTFTLQARTDGTTAEIAAQIPIVFSDYGVTAPYLGFVAVEDTGFVELQLTLTHD